MTDFHGPRDVHDSLIEKTVQIGAIARSPAKVDQDSHAPADFLQFQRLLTGRGIVHHVLTLASRNSAKGRSAPLQKKMGAKAPRYSDRRQPSWRPLRVGVHNLNSVQRYQVQQVALVEKSVLAGCYLSFSAILR
jgi:hypothetical protein